MIFRDINRLVKLSTCDLLALFPMHGASRSGFSYF